MNHQNQRAAGPFSPPGRDPGQNGRRRIAGTAGYVLLAVAGVIAGLAIFIFIILSKPLRADIGIVDPSSFEPISLDDIVLAEESEEIVPWSEGGRTRVYVHPDFPIKKVKQKDPAVETILVFGVDSRGASDIACRADSIILLTIDQSSKSIKMTSVMRDIQVKIEGRSKKDRINAAYAFGGVGLLINTLNETLDLDIQRFAMFDFWSAENLIDAVGGIEMEISKDEIPYVNAGVAEQNNILPGSEPSPEIKKAGLQMIDGRQAIAWARIRKVGSDFARTGRQRTVMETLMRQVAGAGLGRLVALISEGMDSFESNMRSTDMIRLATNALPLADSIEQYHVPENDGMYKVNANPWMMIVDWDKQLPELHDFIWGQD